MILLDTCTFLWLAFDQKKLSKHAKDKLNDDSGGIFVSAITAFEVGILVAKGKIRFRVSAMDWFAMAAEALELREVPVDSKISLMATELPRLHNDPADRILVATAMIHKMELLTPDPLIHQYPNVNVVW